MKVFCVLLVSMLIYAEGNSIVQQDADEIDEKSAAIAANLLPAALDAAKFVFGAPAEFFKFLWGQPARESHPYTYMVSVVLKDGVWQSERLQDGDFIKISRKTKNPDTSYSKVQFTLTQPDSTLWKALTVHTPENKFKYEIVYCQDNVHSYTKSAEYYVILENYLVLSKAKLGFHTNMYWIENAFILSPNYSWEIEWQQG